MTTAVRFEVRKASPRLGAEIAGVDLAAGVDDETAQALREAFWAYKILVFRGQHLSPSQHVEAVRIFVPAFHKRRLFRQEQEVRAVMVWPSYRDLADGITGVPMAAGMAVPVDLSALIQRIVIAPRASSWLSGLVSSILHRYGLSTVPVSSELSREPDW